MLTDHRKKQLQIALRAERDRQVQSAFGDFLKTLLLWVWYMTITFRDNSEFEKRGDAPSAIPLTQSGVYARYAADSRIGEWRPLSHDTKPSHGPSRQRAGVGIQDYLQQMENQVVAAIGWVMANDLGRVTDRYHAHLLIAGVELLDITDWWRRAYHQFGRTRLEMYDGSRGGAYYVAKNALAPDGEIWFGGELLKDVPSREPKEEVGRLVVAHSADVPKALYHMTLGRRRTR